MNVFAAFSEISTLPESATHDGSEPDDAHEPGDSPDLQRVFGLSTATYAVIASMVGVGILTTSGYILRDTGSPGVLLGLWLTGGMLALCGALSVAELASAMPHAGGEYVYMREAYGRPWAFVYGWVSFLIGFSAPAAITAHAAASYLTGPWNDPQQPLSPMQIRQLAAILVIGFSWLHIRGQSASSRVQSVSTWLKLITLIALVVGGIAVGRGEFSHFRPAMPDDGLPWGGLAISLVYVMFSFTGWNAATYLAGETRRAERLVPIALLLGCGGVIALYLALNVVYVYALDPKAVTQMSKAQVEPIAALAAQRLFGPRVAAPFSVAIGLGLLASVSALILTGPRVYYAMARDGLFPAMAARLNPKTQTPNAAIIAQMICSLVLLFTGTFEQILTYTGVGLSISSFFVILAVFVLRVRQPGMMRPFRVPLYPLPPLLFLATVLWMIVFAFQSRPDWSTISLVSILAGIPVYYIGRQIRRNRSD